MSDTSDKPRTRAATVSYPDELPDYPTLIHALDAAARLAPDRPAKICEGRQVTFREYTRAVAGLAHHLIELGLAGKPVGVMFFNSIEASVASLGTMAAGAQAVLINPSFTPLELAKLLKPVKPAAVICDDSGAEKARGLAESLGIEHVVVLGASGIEIDRWTQDETIQLPPFPAPADLAAMFFTGGTTGIPKGADHTHRMLIGFARQKIALLEYEFDTESTLVVAPMFHIFGHHYANVLPIYLRSPLVILPRYKPEVVLEELERNKITLFSGGPAAIYMGMLGTEKMDRTDFSALKYSLSGGAPCPEHLIRTWEEKTGSIFLEGYAMSEAAPLTNNPARGPRKLLSAGLAAPETALEIVDLETGTEIKPPYERGEIRVRGPQVTPGYHNRPEETAEAIRDGWLHTGDIGYLDDDGYLFIVDRKKDMILVGGYNVYPREIDEVLHGHPAIHEAAAAGVPETFRGEVVKAFVVLKPGCSVTEEEIIAYCAERLVRYKVPHFVEFMDALPKTGANKVSRIALREHHLNHTTSALEH